MSFPLIGFKGSKSAFYFLFFSSSTEFDLSLVISVLDFYLSVLRSFKSLFVVAFGSKIAGSTPE